MFGYLKRKHYECGRTVGHEPRLSLVEHLGGNWYRWTFRCKHCGYQWERETAMDRRGLPRNERNAAFWAMGSPIEQENSYDNPQP
jgi:hypothetical protein